MSKLIFKSINNTLDYYQNRLLTPEYNVHFNMFPHLKELTLNKIEIINKLLELIGDKDDNYYQELYNNNFKDVMLKKMYTFNGGLVKFMSFSDINDFLNKITNYQWIDGNSLMNEIKIILRNYQIKNKRKQNLKQRKRLFHQQLKNLFGILILAKKLVRQNVYAVNQLISLNYHLIAVIL
jgi:hypothetical protein